MEDLTADGELMLPGDVHFAVQLQLPTWSHFRRFASGKRMARHRMSGATLGNSTISARYGDPCPPASGPGAMSAAYMSVLCLRFVCSRQS